MFYFNLIYVKFEVWFVKVFWCGDGNVVGEIVGVVFFGWLGGFFYGFVILVVCFLKIEGNFGCYVSSWNYVDDIYWWFVFFLSV